jgi:aldehyde dehydrogenase (NAD+)
MTHRLQDSEAVLSALHLTGALPGVCLGAQQQPGQGDALIVHSPIDGRELARLACASAAQVETTIAESSAAFARLRELPAPRRGELVRRLGEQLRVHKRELAALVSWEVGKIEQEALGEVQEMIDVCEFATGLSRQLYGLTIASERPGHRLAEQWHPLGPVAVISAFNFPVAVWAWNTAIALVCGNPVLWKPSEKTPLTALACQRLLGEVLRDMPDVPEAACALLIGGADVGAQLAASVRVPLVSATGSVAMGRQVAETVARRLGRSLLELGGNNGMIVAPSADLALATRAIVFSAVGTAGQRCTSLRRLIVQRGLYDELVQRLKAIYPRLVVGSPLLPDTLVGPLIDAGAYARLQRALAAARAQGGKVFGGERVTEGVPAGGFYVRPALVEIAPDAPIVQAETFAPLLYVFAYDGFEQALTLHNDVPQGLSSAIFTNDVREAERFCSAAGSDCGIANVNIGTSGAEIGGAFGGEKLTGGGRESGSDAWKQYMRRATNTVNYSSALPLAQGIRFDV